MNPFVEIENVTLSYSDELREPAVQDLSMSIEEGEFSAVVGPSGCGKSTLLKGVAGYMQPVEGTMKLKGREISEPGPDRVMVFPEFDQLLPWKPVTQNITFALLNGGKCSSTKEANDVAMEYITTVSYTHLTLPTILLV